MREAVIAYTKRLAPVYLTAVVVYQLLLYFMVGNIFHRSFMPFIDFTIFMWSWATSIVLCPYAIAACKNVLLEKRWLEYVYLHSCALFIAIVVFRDIGHVESMSGFLTGITVYMLLFLAPKLLKKKHYSFIFWFVCILAGVHAVSQICFVIGQTQQFCGFNVSMPHGRLMRVPQFPLLPLLDGYTGGWFTNPNCLASYIMAVPAISIFLSQASETKTKALRCLAWSICGLTLISLLLTFSRAAILSTMIGMIPLAVYALRKRGVPILASVSFLCVLVVGLFLVQMRFTTLSNPFSLTGRADIWSAVIEALKHLPVFGYGSLGWSANGETPHNVFLANLLFYGVPGFLAFFAWLVSSVALGFSMIRKAPTYGSVALLGFVVSYAFAYSQIEFVLTTPYSFSNSVAMLVIGFLVYLSSKDKKKTKEVSETHSSRLSAGVPAR